ncbi:hypothetical protein CEXT_521471 [Caerostris extrusa]|uniref:Uncharacterized protein n=1 Tax=Caerostris extrusa TaxID=172846 RepID=A0AAV4T7D7_CAEEX|nr:hypothetical protein CEXT_521471 [Caerostris extrusa]
MIAKVLLIVALVGSSFASHHEPEHHHHHPQPYKFGYQIKDHHGEQHRHEHGDGHGNVQEATVSLTTEVSTEKSNMSLTVMDSEPL